MKLYEFSGMVSCHVVVATESEQQARDAIESWSPDGWVKNSDLISVGEVELFDTRDVPSHAELEDVAHVVD